MCWDTIIGWSVVFPSLHSCHDNVQIAPHFYFLVMTYFDKKQGKHNSVHKTQILVMELHCGFSVTSVLFSCSSLFGWLSEEVWTNFLWPYTSVSCHSNSQHLITKWDQMPTLGCLISKTLEWQTWRQKDSAHFTTYKYNRVTYLEARPFWLAENDPYCGGDVQQLVDNRFG